MKYQVAIIGGGPAGYTAAEAAGKAGLSVVLFEKQSLGGVCLNEGCIPTKTLLYSAKTYDGARHAAKYAVSVPEVSFDLPKIIARKQKVVRKLVLGVKGKLTANNVTIVNGEASTDCQRRGHSDGQESCGVRRRNLRMREPAALHRFRNLCPCHSRHRQSVLLDSS